MTRLLLLILACALLRSLESHGSRSVLPNLGLTALLVATNLAFAFATAFASAFASAHPLLPLPPLLGIMALDLSSYFAHVLLHQSPLGWRFHRVHHSDEEVDVTTAFRQHPGESLWRIAWQLPAIVLFALPMEVVALYLALSALNAQLEHANLRVPATLDRSLRLLFVTPDMHKVHHSAEQRQTDTNYANLFSLWDRLFGTYSRPAKPLRYGLDGIEARSFRGLLLLPFLLACTSMHQPPKKVLFLCPYGGAKSVIAATYFNELAASNRLPYVAAAAAAETPYDAVPENVAALLGGEEAKSFKPRHVEPADLASAAKVVSIDCDLTKVDAHGVTIERWDDVPKVSVDLPASAAAIRRHVEELIARLRR